MRQFGFLGDNTRKSTAVKLKRQKPCTEKITGNHKNSRDIEGQGSGNGLEQKKAPEAGNLATVCGEGLSA